MFNIFIYDICQLVWSIFNICQFVFSLKIFGIISSGWQWIAMGATRSRLFIHWETPPLMRLWWWSCWWWLWLYMWFVSICNHSSTENFPLMSRWYNICIWFVITANHLSTKTTLDEQLYVPLAWWCWSWWWWWWWQIVGANLRKVCKNWPWGSSKEGSVRRVRRVRDPTIRCRCNPGWVKQLRKNWSSREAGVLCCRFQFLRFYGDHHHTHHQLHHHHHLAIVLIVLTINCITIIISQ